MADALVSCPIMLYLEVVFYVIQIQRERERLDSNPILSTRLTAAIDLLVILHHHWGLLLEYNLPGICPHSSVTSDSDERGGR